MCSGVIRRNPGHDGVPSIRVFPVLLSRLAAVEEFARAVRRDIKELTTQEELTTQKEKLI
jgi:hypothetical protein